ncbi:tetratricopeptide repeat protein [Streptomyces sp. NPDC055287]
MSEAPLPVPERAKDLHAEARRPGPTAATAGSRSVQVTASARRAVAIGGDNLGIVSTGDGATIHLEIHPYGPAPTALASLPPAPAGFTGRDDELAVLTDLLRPAPRRRPAAGTGPAQVSPLGGGTAAPADDAVPETGAVVVAAVAGTAGVGKTSLAVAAGHLAAQRGYFDAFLFIDLHGYDTAPVLPAQALDALLRSLGVEDAYIPPTLEERAALYRSQLDAMAARDSAVLVIADNASTPQQVRPLLPGSGSHRLLVTSRHTLPTLGARLLDLDVLTPSSALRLLDTALRIADPADTRAVRQEAEALDVARRCGHLPLALQIAAALLIADPQQHFGELAAELARTTGPLDHLDDGERALRSSLDLSFQSLTEPQAETFRRLALSPGPDISTTDAALLLERDDRETRALLAALTRAHLLVRGAVRDRWYMLDLIRVYAQELAGRHAATTDVYRRVQRLLFDHRADTAKAADDHLSALPGQPVPEAFAGERQAMDWLGAERTNLLATVEAAHLLGHHDVACGLARLLAEYLERGRYVDDWVAVATTALASARVLADRRGEATASICLGAALDGARRFQEAAEAHRQALRISHETGDRELEGVALSNLGCALLELGEYEEAVGVHRRDLAICQEFGDLHGEGKAWHNLGNVLRHLRRFDEALYGHQQDLRICRSLGDRRGEGAAWQCLGVVLTEVRRFDEAVDALKEALALFVATEDRFAEAGALTDLGIVLRETRRYEEAAEAHRQVRAVYEEFEDAHGVSCAWGNLGRALTGLGEFEEALDAHRRDLSMRQEAGDRLGEAQAWCNLGVTHAAAGQFPEAIEAHLRDLALCLQGEDRPREGAAWNGLGIAYTGVGRFDEAIEAHRRDIAICQEAGDQYGEGVTWNDLGAPLTASGKYDEAAQAHLRAIGFFRRTNAPYEEGEAFASLAAALAADGRDQGEVRAAWESSAAAFTTAGAVSEAAASRDAAAAV